MKILENITIVNTLLSCNSSSYDGRYIKGIKYGFGCYYNQLSDLLNQYDGEINIYMDDKYFNSTIDKSTVIGKVKTIIRQESNSLPYTSRIGLDISIEDDNLYDTLKKFENTIKVLLVNNDNKVAGLLCFYISKKVYSALFGAVDGMFTYEFALLGLGDYIPKNNDIKKMKKRSDYISWNQYFMGIAQLSTLRSKDPSTQVGACIVKDNKILSVGYNGFPFGISDDKFPWI